MEERSEVFTAMTEVHPAHQLQHTSGLRDSSACCLRRFLCSQVESVQRVPRLVSKHGFVYQGILVALATWTGGNLQELGSKLLLKHRPNFTSV
jgi:hypothetical protein